VEVSRFLAFATVCMMAATGSAYAGGPVGGSETPGDPSLLVTGSDRANTSIAIHQVPDKKRELIVEPQRPLISNTQP
jgi:hypothetical protein